MMKFLIDWEKWGDLKLFTKRIQQLRKETTWLKKEVVKKEQFQE